MDVLNFMFVPTILFMVVVAPIWLSMHYRSVKQSSRSLNEDDRHTIEQMLETVDKLTDRIGSLEAILEADHPQWQQKMSRQARGEE